MPDERMTVNLIVKDNFVLLTLSSKAPGILPILLYKKRQRGCYHSTQTQSYFQMQTTELHFFQVALNIMINHI